MLNMVCEEILELSEELAVSIFNGCFKPLLPTIIMKEFKLSDPNFFHTRQDFWDSRWMRVKVNAKVK